MKRTTRQGAEKLITCHEKTTNKKSNSGLGNFANWC